LTKINISKIKRVVPLLWKNHPTDKSNIYLVRDNIIGISQIGL